MKSGWLGLAIERGATFGLRLTWKDAEGEPIDLTGCTARLKIWRQAGDASTLANLAATVGDDAGTLEFGMAPATVDAIEARQGVHAVEVTHPGGEVTRLLDGPVDFLLPGQRPPRRPAGAYIPAGATGGGPGVLVVSATEVRIVAVGVQGPPGPAGSGGGGTGTDGNDGWTPVFAVATDGTRRVLQVSDWTGGEGTKPATGKYVGASGLVTLIADAVDVRGPAGADGANGTNGADGADGADGNDGWSPVFAVATDGARRVLQVSDWTGGEGTKPATGKYVGGSGLVTLIADAVDVRGPAGADGANGTNGADGADGADGVNGTDGNDGWTPVFAVAADGARRVLQVSDWTGGEGTKPATGKYVGASGLVTLIADAVDVRGPAGADGADGADGTDGNTIEIAQVHLTAIDGTIGAKTNAAYLIVPWDCAPVSFRIDCDPGNEPTSTVEVDMNTRNRTSGATTSLLSAVATITAGNNTGTGTISGTPTLPAGTMLTWDIDQGSDGKGLSATVTLQKL